MNTSFVITHKVKVEDVWPRAQGGAHMGDCEVCGAMKVGTRTAVRGRTTIEACKKCIDRMGLDVNTAPPVRKPIGTSGSTMNKTSGGYGGRGKKGKDIMMRRTKELRSDFASAIRHAREQNGWDQRELAKRMAERVNIIQHTEGGKRPTDSVIKKFERILDLKLMTDREPEEESDVHRSSSRPLTMADLYEQAKKEQRGE